MASAAPFSIRGAHFNMVTLQLREGSAATVIPALQQLIHQSPAFLKDSPVVLGLDELAANGATADFPGLIAGLKGLKLVPVGAAGGNSALRKAATDAGLAQLTKGQQLFKQGEQQSASAQTAVAPQAQPPAADTAPEPEPPPEPSAEPEQESPAPAPNTESAAPEPQPAMLVTTPVRAGNRIYAQGRDVICTATVNAGAEIIADGHVHVYGTLRGRAIAGASGFDGARIFALNFDPELVAIAGLYRVREDLNPSMIGTQVQVSLSGEEMQLAALV